MLWAFAAAGATGVLLGLWFRVTALAVVSGVTAAAGLSATLYAGMGLMPAGVLTFAFLGALQVGYLAGLTLARTWSRASLEPHTGIQEDQRTAAIALASSARSSPTDQRRT